MVSGGESPTRVQSHSKRHERIVSSALISVHHLSHAIITSTNIWTFFSIPFLIALQIVVTFGFPSCQSIHSKTKKKTKKCRPIQGDCVHRVTTTVAVDSRVVRTHTSRAKARRRYTRTLQLVWSVARVHKVSVVFHWKDYERADGPSSDHRVHTQPRARILAHTKHLSSNVKCNKISWKNLSHVLTMFDERTQKSKKKQNKTQ